jgi:spore germination protein KA
VRGIARGKSTVSGGALRTLLEGSDDIIFTPVAAGADGKIKLTIAFVDGLADRGQINEAVLKPLMRDENMRRCTGERELLRLITGGSAYHCSRELHDTMEGAVEAMLSGQALLVFDGRRTAVAFDVRNYEKRAISEPTNESVIKGSKESFVEALAVNIALIRRRIQIPELKIERFRLGKYTGTSVALVYIEGLADSGVTDAVRENIAGIKAKGIVSAGQIETALTGGHRTFFPQILYTERTDKFCGSIVEGRVGVLADGLPVAYIEPVDFNSLVQAPDDYAFNSLISSVFRLLRYACVFAALILPAFYVSVTSFHQEMIPTQLVSSIISSKQGVPFPTYIEVLFMLLAFEVLLEAGLRLPQTVGQAVSIVGALVVGQAAISAHMMSPGVVIVISVAGITGFVLPSQELSNTIRLGRIILVALATVGGLFTVTLGLTLALYHMCTLVSFGMPYLSPFVARDGKNMFRDTVIILPKIRKGKSGSKGG